MNRRELLYLSGAFAFTAALGQPARAQTGEIARYTAIALQTRCDAVNPDKTPEAARARMDGAIARVGREIAAARGFLQGFNGYPVRLVVLPEYWMTGFPLGETREEWMAKATIRPGGPQEAAIAAIASRFKLFVCSNHYETDEHFPGLYFQANVIYGPDGATVLRYRRMISLYTPTPYDVWDQYLEIYGPDAIFPVADTEIGVLGTIASEEILYPEVARMLTLKGAEVLLHLTSEVGSPALTPKHISKKARAVENMAYVVSANSAGIFGTPVTANATDGMSIVLDPYGRTLAEAGTGDTFNANAVLDIGELRESRQKTGMTNLLSRLPMAAFAPAYAQADHAPANFMADGRMRERAEVLEKQALTIKRLIESGVLK
jgi:predicted amidohydrolase